MKVEHLEKYRRLGLKISYYRKMRKMTQEALAEKVNITTPFLGAVEAPNMDSAISLDTLFDIADALDIPAYRFL